MKMTSLAATSYALLIISNRRRSNQQKKKNRIYFTMYYLPPAKTRTQNQNICIPTVLLAKHNKRNVSYIGIIDKHSAIVDLDLAFGWYIHTCWERVSLQNNESP